MKIKKPPKRFYFVPTLFTLTNLFFGFLSLLLTYHGRYRMAAFWIILAAIMDGLDGIVARATQTPSEFGIELDSLSDAVSFGLATSLLLYFWGLKPAGPPAVFFGFIFLTTGVLRLARYNVRTRAVPDRRFYQGLTVPSAAIFMASLVIFHPTPLETRELAFVLAAVVVLVALCMVSTFPYRNYTKLFTGHRIDIPAVMILAAALAGAIFYTRIFLPVFFGLNVLSGPAIAIVRAVKKTRAKKGQPKDIPL